MKNPSKSQDVKKVLLILAAVLLAPFAGDVLKQASARLRGAGGKEIQYWDARSTMSESGENRPQRMGAVSTYGSQVIRFMNKQAEVSVYHIARGQKKLLHQLTLGSSWMPALHFTVCPSKEGRTCLSMLGEPLITEKSVLPKREPNEQYRLRKWWDYDMGKVQSVYPFVNGFIRMGSVFVPQEENAAIAYQFTRKEDNFFFRATNGPGGEVKESIMRENSRKDDDLEFIMITVRVLPGD